MTLPTDYLQRVYAGVLGKIIGVYLGRPFEGKWHADVLRDLGEINYYVHEKCKVPLIVTDDDISGTFTFLRALPDHGNTPKITAEQIGQSWLNYIIENRTILWWGGLGMSTEHTAFLRLKAGIPAPRSGSIALNSKVVAEQIGSQIFIDGWAMVAPGNPALAADLAKRAASVSHDGEAIYGAQVIAAAESAAFVESDLDKILDTAVSFIPRDSVIFRMIAELRAYHAKEPHDWQAAFRDIMQKTYNYETYGGNCHMVPNHGVIILALLYGQDDFQRALMIANTCGWDTDCNSGNVGCFMGIKLGLEGIDAGPDFRGPVADRMYLPTADGGRGITDAVTETLHIVNSARAMAGEKPLLLKNGAKFHFELPGSLQGFIIDNSVDSRDTATLENETGHSESGSRCLAIHYRKLAPGRVTRLATATFTPPDALKMSGYGLVASPTLFSGQTVRAALEADAANLSDVSARLFFRVYNAKDELELIAGEAAIFSPGQSRELIWTIPPTDGRPIAEIGIELAGEKGATGTAYLDYLTWTGEPNIKIPLLAGQAGKRSWVDAMDNVWPDKTGWRLIQNVGRGTFSTGTRDWQNYRVTAVFTPHLVKSIGLAARYQGLKRYYAILLGSDGIAKLVKVHHTEQTLATAPVKIEQGKPVKLELEVAGQHLRAWADGRLIAETRDADFTVGGIALLLDEGRTAVGEVAVIPAG